MIDSRLYGLSPLDFNPDQIKKMPGQVLWRYIKEDPRFEDELISRVVKIEDIAKQIEMYSYSKEDVKRSPRLVQLVNELAPYETKYNTLSFYFDVLTEENKKHTMRIYFNNAPNISYTSYLNPVSDRMDFIDKDCEHLVKAILELLSDARPPQLLLDTVAHISTEKFLEVLPEIKQKGPNCLIGQLLYFVKNIPEEEHLHILQSMSKLSGLHNIRDKTFKTLIDPGLLKKLPTLARVNVLRDMSMLKAYPFQHKIPIEYIKALLFPASFKRSSDVKFILSNWEKLDSATV